jgi:hypothetical protein
MEETPEADPDGQWPLPAFQLILRFLPGLTTIVLIGDNKWGFVPFLEELEEYRQAIQGFLERHKESFRDGVAPVVKAKFYDDLFHGKRAFGGAAKISKKALQ